MGKSKQRAQKSEHDAETNRRIQSTPRYRSKSQNRGKIETGEAQRPQEESNDETGAEAGAGAENLPTEAERAAAGGSEPSPPAAAEGTTRGFPPPSDPAAATQNPSILDSDPVQWRGVYFFTVATETVNYK